MLNPPNVKKLLKNRNVKGKSWNRKELKKEKTEAGKKRHGKLLYHNGILHEIRHENVVINTRIPHNETGTHGK